MRRYSVLMLSFIVAMGWFIAGGEPAFASCYDYVRVDGSKNVVCPGDRGYAELQGIVSSNQQETRRATTVVPAGTRSAHSPHRYSYIPEKCGLNFLCGLSNAMRRNNAKGLR